MTTEQQTTGAEHDAEPFREHTIDRRRFLQNAGLVAAAPALGSLLGTSGSEFREIKSLGSSSGGTLVYAMEIADIPPLDPHLALNSGSSLLQAIMPMFEGLVLDYLSTTGKQAPFGQPHLAKSWKLLDGGKTWEWELRPNVLFHDGTPWNADAAIWNFRRIYDKTSPQYFAEAAALMGDFMPGPILALEKVNNLTFRMTLPISRPLNQEFGWIWCVSPTAVEKLGNEGFGKAPVGTGGMRFENLVPGQQFEMVRNEKYWGTPFKLNKLIVRPIADGTARANAIITREVNMAVEINPDSLGPLKKAGDIVHLSSRVHTWDVLLNTQAPPFNNKRVRQALNYAIDREAIATDILKGTAQPMNQIVEPGSPWYNPSIRPYTYDPHKAKAMLAAAGYPKGLKSHWLCPINGSGNLDPVAIMEVVQSNLVDIGVDLTVTTYEWTDYLSFFFKGYPSGVDGMAISYGPMWTYWWGLLWSTEYLPPAGALNVGRYTNPAITPLYNKALAIAGSDPAKSARYLQAIAAIVWADAPWLFVVHGDNVRATTPNVHGYVNTEDWLFGWPSIGIS
jgi:peptide/nickel transport system substrate-binding protein